MDVSVRRSLLYLGIAVAILAALLMAGVWAATETVEWAWQQATGTACPNPVLSHRCQVGVGFIEAATGVVLPAGTVVVSARTSDWLSWRLHAVVAIPEDTAAPPQTTGTATSVTYRGTDTHGRLLVSIDQVRPAGQAWPTP